MIITSNKIAAQVNIAKISHLRMNLYEVMRAYVNIAKMSHLSMNLY